MCCKVSCGLDEDGNQNIQERDRIQLFRTRKRPAGADLFLLTVIPITVNLPNLTNPMKRFTIYRMNTILTDSVYSFCNSVKQIYSLLFNKNELLLNKVTQALPIGC